MSHLVDFSTVLAAAAGLWALAIAWWTYVWSVRKHGQDLHAGLTSIIIGLRSELDFMKFWSGSYGEGYLQKRKIEESDEEWSYPTRLIWAFPYETVKSLPQSPYALHLGELIVPFLKLSFSISKFFQHYEEYRRYALSQPDLYHFFRLRRVTEAKPSLSPQQKEYADVVRDFNYHLHVRGIGGADSTDEECLYKAHKRAFEKLNAFERKLGKPSLPRLFLVGHALSAIFFLLGVCLVVQLAR